VQPVFRLRARADDLNGKNDVLRCEAVDARAIRGFQHGGHIRCPPEDVAEPDLLLPNNREMVRTGPAQGGSDEVNDVLMASGR
jgi:hypothetical protein